MYAFHGWSRVARSAFIQHTNTHPLFAPLLSRAAFAMGLLATKKDDSELAEALHLEAVLVLDRLPEVERAKLH